MEDFLLSDNKFCLAKITSLSFVFAFTIATVQFNALFSFFLDGSSCKVVKKRDPRQAAQMPCVNFSLASEKSVLELEALKEGDGIFSVLLNSPLAANLHLCALGHICRKNFKQSHGFQKKNALMKRWRS